MAPLAGGKARHEGALAGTSFILEQNAIFHQPAPCTSGFAVLPTAICSPGSRGHCARGKLSTTLPNVLIFFLSIICIWQLVMENLLPSMVRSERMALASAGNNKKPLLDAPSWLKVLADVRLY